MKSYLHQTRDKGHSCCTLIALLNARIFYGVPLITSLDDPRWDPWTDKYCCKTGAAIGWRKAAVEFELDLYKIGRDDVDHCQPVMISSYTQAGFHSSLVIESGNRCWTVANYDSHHGPVLQSVFYDQISWPKKGVPVDEHNLILPSDSLIGQFDNDTLGDELTRVGRAAGTDHPVMSSIMRNYQINLIREYKHRNMR